MTPATLYRRVLQKLGVIAAGEDPQAADARLVEDRYAAVFEAMVDQSLVDWSLEEDIPADAEAAITMVVAAASADEFQVPEPRYGRLIAEGALFLPNPSLGERMLRKRASQPFIRSEAGADFY